jgi:hypothetical protein
MHERTSAEALAAHVPGKLLASSSGAGPLCATTPPTPNLPRLWALSAELTGVDAFAATA